MTLGPIDDPIEAVVTETLSQAINRQANKITKLHALLAEIIEVYPLDTDLYNRIRAELKDRY
jgi:hypothetical protein